MARNGSVDRPQRQVRGNFCGDATADDEGGGCAGTTAAGALLGEIDAERPLDPVHPNVADVIANEAERSVLAAADATLQLQENARVEVDPLAKCVTRSRMRVGRRPR